MNVCHVATFGLAWHTLTLIYAELGSLTDSESRGRNHIAHEVESDTMQLVPATARCSAWPRIPDPLATPVRLVYYPPRYALPPP